jgi:hypothetical protein
MDSVVRDKRHRWVAGLVVTFAVLGGAFALGLLLWDVLGIMSAPIDIVVAVVLVRLLLPGRGGQPSGAD